MYVFIYMHTHNHLMLWQLCIALVCFNMGTVHKKKK